MESRRCSACGKSFRPHRQISQQCYCPAPACQRERRRRWQQQKRRSDPDYKANQKRAQAAWRRRNPDYWRDYRRTHAEYAERNRSRQRDRNNRRRQQLIAKKDVSEPTFRIPSGIYQISESPPGRIAKMDTWTVKITLLQESCAQLVHGCKERT